MDKIFILNLADLADIVESANASGDTQIMIGFDREGVKFKYGIPAIWTRGMGEEWGNQWGSNKIE